MNLHDEPLLFLDIQSTGMRPPRGQVLEIGWAYGALCEGVPVVSSQVFALPEDHRIERKIAEITGLGASDLEGKPHARPWFSEHFAIWLEELRPSLAVVHCAQFERPFLEDLLPSPTLSFLCTQQITRRLFPELPSQNLRAVSGYFGHPVTGPNRAGDFTLATVAIWHGLTERLHQLNIHTHSALQEWLKEERPKSKRTISYRIPDQLRLSLPDQPGIYKMFSKAGEVLYIGKATSLKDRVNSYFRGVKNRDRRKLEMLAQVWDLKVEVCDSPLEAALRETDEIKRFNPRYNVSLKKNQRQLCFYSRDFERCHTEQSQEFPLGPFRPGGNIEMVQMLCRSLRHGRFEQIFWDPIDVAILESGFELFHAAHPKVDTRSMRGLLAYGRRLHRHYTEPEIAPGEATEEKLEAETTPESVAGKYERLLRRAGGELHRSKQIHRALEMDVEFVTENGPRRLSFRGGMYNSYPQEKSDQKKFAWAGLDIETYDRLSVLLSELSRSEHHILRHGTISPP